MFSKDFSNTARNISRQIFRVFSHMYTSHYDMIIALNEEGHVNTLFTHFMYFSRLNDLLDRKEITPVIMELSEALGVKW